MFKLILYIVLIQLYTYNEDNSVESTNSLPSFRKQVEEIIIEKPLLRKTDDATDNLVSFLVKNAGKIFSELEETTAHLNPTINNDETTIALRKTVATYSSNKEADFNIAISENELSFDREIDEKDLSSGMVINDIIPNENITKSTKANKTCLTIATNSTVVPSEVFRDLTKKAELLKVSNDLIILQKAEQAERDNQALVSIDPSIFNKSIQEREQSSSGRSCIFCDNVAIMDCYDPKNKLIPSHMCEREEDLCYSQHTPFGIVDRGCFNVNHNLSTYVCSCNLCNYISISEMPYIFSTKRDWVENVIELSRTRRLRQSVLKEMSCLRCEVNTSTTTGDMLDNANCLEGNVVKLPIQECSENEICGVKAIRSKGYIWRGCVIKPLYNYWWTLCDSDLCNYDSLVSIYDEL